MRILIIEAVHLPPHNRTRKLFPPEVLTCKARETATPRPPSASRARTEHIPSTTKERRPGTRLVV